jgi:hypothetical protein
MIRALQMQIATTPATNVAAAKGNATSARHEETIACNRKGDI